MVGHFLRLPILSSLPSPLVPGGEVLELIPFGGTGALPLHLHVGVIGELEPYRVRQGRWSLTAGRLVIETCVFVGTGLVAGILTLQTRSRVCINARSRS